MVAAILRTSRGIDSKFAFKAVCVDIEDQKFLDPRCTFKKRDATEFLREETGLFDFIIANAALHEIWMSNKSDYLSAFLERIALLLSKGGRCYIGDYYYGEISDTKMLDRYFAELRTSLGHADPIERFYHNDELISAVQKHQNFSLIETNEVRVTDKIERFYYGILLKKRE